LAGILHVTGAPRFDLLTDPISPAALAEPELITRILKGERKLFHDLVRPYERAVYVTVYAILRNHADAEEAAQDTMIKALTRLSQLHAPDKFKAWLLQIAVNEAKLKCRDSHPQQYESLDRVRDENKEHFMPRDFADWRELPSENLDRKEIRKAISQALQGLAPTYREVFVLRDVQRMSGAECASLLEVTEQVVKVRLHRARLMVREKLAPTFKRRWFDRLLLLKGKNPW